MTILPYEGLELWFLTGSQALYGADALQQVAEQSQQIADQLQETGGNSRPRRMEAGPHHT